MTDNNLTAAEWFYHHIASGKLPASIKVISATGGEGLVTGGADVSDVQARALAFSPSAVDRAVCAIYAIESTMRSLAEATDAGCVPAAT